MCYQSETVSMLEEEKEKMSGLAEQLDDEIQLLRACRNELEHYRIDIARIEAEIANSELGQRLAREREDMKAVADKVSEVEARVRDLALRCYAETGNKRPHTNVEVKVFNVCTYDEKVALEYAREHIPAAVKLDRKVFERAAEAMQLDFVTFLKEPRAQIATKL